MRCRRWWWRRRWCLCTSRYRCGGLCYGSRHTGRCLDFLRFWVCGRSNSSSSGRAFRRSIARTLLLSRAFGCYSNSFELFLLFRSCHGCFDTAFKDLVTFSQMSSITMWYQSHPQLFPIASNKYQRVVKRKHQEEISLEATIFRTTQEWETSITP